ncbi:MAG: hypothetical protein ACYDH6_15150 [Acidimicrobiales bacterium]
MRSARWIHSPGADTALALCWVPFALVTMAAQHNAHLLAAVLSAVLLLSLSHQPVTLALVYGDKARFKDHARLYTMAPLAALAAVVIGLRVSFLLVALAAALWNAEHTLMQRYGVTRMYGRKGGDQRGGMEKPMLFSWLAVAVAAAGANPATARDLAKVQLGDVNKRAITLLVHLRPEATVILVPLLVGAVALTARWVRAEAADAHANSAKWIYVGSTAALIIILCANPVAGFAAYVGAHAVEYFVIVRSATDRRAHAGDGGAVGVVARSRVGATGFVIGAAAGAVVPLVVLQHTSTFTIATATYLTVGALHIVYDGCIWKMRQPAVARDLAVAA